MIRRSRSTHGSTDVKIPDIVHFWSLKILVPLGAQREFVGVHGFQSDGIAEAIGLGHWLSPDIAFDPVAVRAELRKLYQSACRKPAPKVDNPQLTANLRRLANLVGLTETDCRILEFAVILRGERMLDEVADWLGYLSATRAYRALATVLDLPENVVREALSADGVLARSGLVRIDHNGSHQLNSKIDLLSDSFADQMQSVDSNPIQLLKGTITPAAAPSLAIGDFDHVRDSLAILRPYLAHAVQTHRAGVNVFLHGQPGTGKSELARVLAAELGLELFEVASEDNDGDPVNGERRLRAFRAAQCFLANRPSLIVFDEVEDVFNDGNGLFGRKSTAQTRKAWINRTLEENLVPTIWLSNSVECVDPAFIRRFDVVFELPVPSKRQRARIIRETCGDLLSAPAADAIANADKLAPGVITRAASVVRAICDVLPPAAAEQAVEQLVNNTLTAQGHPRVRRQDANRLPEHYDPCFVNADENLPLLAQGIVQTGQGRLCLYGPPGTGKTAFGRWLAEQLGKPLLVKRGSDLLSMWLGGTEQNIMRAFREAEQDDAVLLLDEVDGFLQTREGAQRSWEVTSVNEMLTQLESYSGVLVASTNILNGLDPASLRRFDLKVRFGYLKVAQAQQLFVRQCETLRLPPSDEHNMRRLARLDTLTPGDFAAAARQHQFRPFASAEGLLDALEMECTVKRLGRTGAIGFV